jgi:membrane protein DedA with SNARE-associated domain
MFENYLDFITQGLETLKNGQPAALALLFLVLVLSEFGIPLPFVMQGVRFYIGYTLGQGSLSVLALIPILTIGRQFGAACLYWLTRLLSNSLANWYHKRFKPMKTETEKIGDKLKTKIPFMLGVMILGRITPGLLVPVTLASAIIKLNYGYFALGVLVSSIIYDAVFILLAMIFGHQFETGGFNIIATVSLSFFIILTFAFWIVRWLRRDRTKRLPNE